MSLRETTSVRQSVRAALRSRARIVLAVSGGLDSMVLLDAAAATVPASQLIVATFDHGTGSAATAAQDLVRRSAEAHGLEVVCGVAVSVLESEAELREARWRFLRETARAAGAFVATAHSADDQVETVLMRILRDAGPRGIAALYAESDVMRPLLHLTRRELARYARSQGLTWLEDPSNASRRFLRNRVRHDLLPSLRRARAGFDEELLAVARQAARWRREIESYVATALDIRPVQGGLDVCVTALVGRSLEELRILWPAIAARGGVTLDRRGTVRLAEFTTQGRVGARIQLAGGWEVVRSRDALQLRASGEGRPTDAPLALSNRTVWGAWSFAPLVGEPDDAGWAAWLPTDRSLSIRSWMPGDTMSGPDGALRKVKRCLNDAGITGHERTGWPVVLAGDEIVWIPGVRRRSAAAARSGRPGLPFICEYANR